MKKILVVMFTFLLVLCVAAPSLAGVLPGLLTPWEHQHIKQGDKVKFTATWSSDIPIVKVQWTMDSEVVWEKKVNPKKSSGASAYTLHARDFPVKLFPDGATSSYELCCILWGADGPIDVWADVSVYIEPRTP
jgi:hypothetical protein